MREARASTGATEPVADTSGGPVATGIDLDSLVDAFEAERSSIPTMVVAETDHGPVVELIDRLIAQALGDRASDIHIEPQDNQVRVRFRIDGALHDIVTFPSNVGPALVSRLKILASMNIVERRRPQDGHFQTLVDTQRIDIRVSTAPTIWGETAVLRILDPDRRLLQLDQLGMTPATVMAFNKLAHSPFGMVVCAGPTGSGKTTTLYAALVSMDESERNVTTIEDPVEYIFPEFNQIQINEQAGITFADGLRSILRQDPDVILVGEIRDVPTARIAVQSALTGHLVLSSIHATDSVSALLRFVDMGVEPFLVASSLLGVVSQRLVRRTCPNCRVPHASTSEELAFFLGAGGDPKTSFVHGAGCAACAGTGYRERIGVYELLHLTTEVKQLLLDQATAAELRSMAVSQGMRSLLDEGVALVQDGVTTVAEIMRSIYTL
jgi:type IV pilus assembly protein PilB